MHVTEHLLLQLILKMIFHFGVNGRLKANFYPFSR